MEQETEKRKESDVIGLGWEYSAAGIQVINIAINQEKISLLPEDKFGSVRLKIIKNRTVHEKSRATHKVVIDRLWKINESGTV